MPRVTPQQAAAQLRSRIGQSGQQYAAGIERVTVNPAETAIANKDKWVAGIQEAIQNDRYAKGLANVTLQSWKQAATQFGTQRYTQSAAKAEENYLRFANDFFPYLQQVENEIAAMPNLTLQDRLDRMLHNANRLHEYRNR